MSEPPRPEADASDSDSDSAGVYDGLSAEALNYGDLRRAGPTANARRWLRLAALISIFALVVWLLVGGSL